MPLLGPRVDIGQLLGHALADVSLTHQLFNIEEVFVLEDIFLGEFVDTFPKVVKDGRIAQEDDISY